MEAIVRAEGAIPATVGVIEGEVHVGLSSEELDQLARCKSPLKVSRRDLPYIISKVRPQHAHLKYKSQNNLLKHMTGSHFCFEMLSCMCMLFTQGLSGGTTVAATMIAAHRAGIPVFVTGGIGGVHRDGENSKQTLTTNTLYTY